MLKQIVTIMFFASSIFAIWAQHIPVGTAGWQLGPKGFQGYVLNSRNWRVAQLTSPVYNSHGYLGDVRTKQNQILYRIANPLLPKSPKSLFLNRRKLGIAGYSFYPSIAAGLAWVKEQSANSDLSVEDAGISIVPSLNLALPFSEIEFNLNTTYYFKGRTSLGKFNFQPTIGFKVDGLFEMLGHDVDLKSSTELTTLSTVIDDVKYNGDGTKTISYHYAVNTKRNEYYSWTILAFGGLTPRYTFTRPMPYIGKTEMLGLGYNLRGMNSGLDIIAETGNVGYASMAAYPAYTYDPVPQDRSIAEDSGLFSSVGKQTRVFARYSIDLKELLFGLLSQQPDPGETVLAKSTTKFAASKKSNAFRVMGGIGFGYAWVQKPKFIYEGAEAAMEKKLFENPDMLHNGWNDPRKIKNGLVVHYFVAIEFGVMGVEWGTTQLRSTPLSAGKPYSTISLYYTFPIIKMYDNYKGIKQARKKLLESK